MGHFTRKQVELMETVDRAAMKEAERLGTLGEFEGGKMFDFEMFFLDWVGDCEVKSRYLRHFY